MLGKNRKEGSRTRQLAARPSFACVPDCEEDAQREGERKKKTTDVGARKRRKEKKRACGRRKQNSSYTTRHET